MAFAEIVLLACGLAMDAMVAATRGVALDRVEPRHLALVAGFFGGAQALMPLVGWAIGSRVGGYIEAWDHRLVLAILGFIGGKMLWEARSTGNEPPAEGAER